MASYNIASVVIESNDKNHGMPQAYNQSIAFKVYNTAIQSIQALLMAVTINNSEQMLIKRVGSVNAVRSR